MKKKNVEELLNLGFNVMPIREDKTPFGSWKKWQTEKITIANDSDHHALICGFNDVECIDVDLKILHNNKERDDFFSELRQMLTDNIPDFINKVVIKKTKNFGYHLIYRANNIEGNLKLAKLKNHTEAIIETRGAGGYIAMYDNIYVNDYRNINYISDEDREIIIGVCRSFNEQHEPVIEPIDKATKNKYHIHNNSITPWVDYNNKTHVWDLISHEFSIVKKTSSKLFVKRHGAKSPHSGYIYTDSNCLYVFSTGTSFDIEKLYSPFAIYTHDKHFGDFSAAAKDLYEQGYGDRFKPDKIIPEHISIEPIIEKTNLPIDIFPEELQGYITKCSNTLNASVDYMGCSLLWITSLIIGNTINIKVKEGWSEISTLWISIVGEAGIGKTPSTSLITRPLEAINGKLKKEYSQKKKDYEQYQTLDKAEKEFTPEPDEPSRQQFIVDDVTIEALINLHAENPKAVGVLKDELAGWFKDMNKYKEGSDKEAWLSSWSGKGISVDRITRQSDYIAKPLLPVLGGIQPSILQNFFTSDNKDSGFLDRMLFSYPDLTVNRYSEEDIDPIVLAGFDLFVVSFHEEMNKLIKFSDNGDIEPHVATWSNSAKKEWVRIFNEITEKQNSDNTPEFLKSALPKLKSYVCRFALNIHAIEVFFNGDSYYEISKESILKAEKLYKYFLYMYEKLVVENSESANTAKILKDAKGNVKDKLKAIIKNNPNYKKTAVAKQLNISRQTLYRYEKEIQKN